MRRYEAIIFDLDGVICHTDQYHYQAWKRVADELGIYFDETVNHRLRGVSRLESLEIILERYDGTLSGEEKNSYAEKKNGFYRKLLEKMSPKDVTDEIRETLDVLRRRGLKLAIGSSSRNTQFILKQTGLADYFDAVSDGNQIAHSKPHPEIFLRAGRYLKTDPSKCLVVEDAAAGLEAAAAGGMDSAAIGDVVRYGRATYNLERFSDLLDITV